ncbi:hypothetical protein [Haloarcula litorea]|uniref:hypothetical protein n=1 Tax=Haloarcula litorea TaxID=3032579 RepID=UPI0023E8C5C3|nr:hypothetical protein [Halomicroarcula sp. GDY20]
MTEVPSVPDEFNSEEELKQYIDQLHDQIEFLEEELENSEKDKLELKQELNDLEEQASRRGELSGGFQGIMEPLEAMQQRLEEFEKGKLDEIGGGPSGEAKEEFFDAAGWHPDNS